MSKNLTARSLAFLISAVALSACGSSTALSPSPLSKVSVAATTGSASIVSVPWIDKPATIPTTTVATIALSATCKPANLKVGTAIFGSAIPKKVWTIPIADSGSQPCSLPGYLPDITAIDPNGNRVALSNSPVIRPDPTVVFQPGVAVNFQILFAAHCDSAGLVQPSKYYSSVKLTLPRGTLDLSNLSLKLCGDSIISGFMPVPPPTPAPGTVESLTANVVIPKTVKAGSLLHYQVVLENQSDKAIDLQPCPVYQEGIAALGGPIQTSSQILELNCTTVHLIKPHQKITYEMVIPVPSETGPAKFSWQVEPEGPYAGAGLTIGE